MMRSTQFSSERTQSREVKRWWLDFPQEARSIFASFAEELPPEMLEKRGWGRVLWFAKVMFFRLTPARRAILLLALGLQLSSLILSVPALWVSTNRALLSSVCLLVLLALDLADRVALKRDLELAREIQSWLVPGTPPRFDGVDIAFAILAERLHRSCCADSGGGRHFTTAFLAKYEDAAHSLCYVNAGHNPPLLRRASGSTLQLEATGIPFGMLRSATYEVRWMPVDPGDLLLVYTDGVVEAADPAGNEYGLDRLSRFVRETTCSSAEFQQQLFDDLDAFTAGGPQHDDITVMVVQFSR